jgi:hypothetical protein
MRLMNRGAVESVDVQVWAGARKSIVARSRPYNNGFSGGDAPRVAHEVGRVSAALRVYQALS